MKTIKGLIPLLLLAGALFTAPVAAFAGNVVDENSTVTLHYSMTVDGEVLDDTRNREPLKFVYGQDAILPGVAEQIKGLKAGDKKSFSLEPAEAFGEPVEEAVVEMPRDQLQGMEGDLTPGMAFTGQGPGGMPVRGIVKEVKAETVVMDFNHPLAGKKVAVELEILTVE